MELQKYSINQELIETVFAWVKAGEIAMNATDQKALESETDGLVYGLYGLTEAGDEQMYDQPL
jgi:hypothetical protein